MKRTTLANLLLSVYFVFYAISPLTYPVPARKAAAAGLEPVKPAVTLQSPHVFLWELIVARLTARSETRHGEAGGTILIMKKRALVPEDDSSRPGPHPPVLPKSAFAFPVWNIPAKLVIADAPRKPLTDGYLIFAGHSPPAV